MAQEKIRQFILFIIIMIIGVLPAHSIEKDFVLSGTLAITTSQGVEILDLKTLNHHVVENNHWPSVLTKVDNNHVIMDGDHGIVELDLKTGDAKKIRSTGRYPQYIQEHQKIIFNHWQSPSREDKALFVADIADPENAEEIMLPEYGKYGLVRGPTTQVSASEIVFHYNEKLWVYNIILKAVKELSIPCPQPKLFRNTTIFRSTSGELLCNYYGSSGKRDEPPFLVNLNDGAKKVIPELLGHYPILYLQKFDSLITYKDRFQFWPPNKMGERIDLWVYNFKNGKAKLLKKNFRAGAAVWLEK